MLRTLNLFKTSQVGSLFNLSRSIGSPTVLATSKTDDSEAEGAISDEQRRLAARFKKYFKCSQEEALKLAEKNKTLYKVPTQQLNKNVEFLMSHNVRVSTIMEHPWLLGIALKDLQMKLLRIRDLNPRDLNDFVPLMRASLPALNKIRISFEKDRNSVPEDNRIYYFATRLQVEPATIAKHFYNHLFMFRRSFDLIVEILDILIEFKVPSQRILRDLWAFNYDPTAIRARFEYCQKTEEGNLKPWMIRCTEEILERALTLAKEKKALLGDDTIVQYLSQRLDVEVEIMKRLVDRYESIKKMKVGKVKQVLDYLLLEEKFEPRLVVNSMKIFLNSLDRTKQRIEELKRYGCRPTTLSFICQSDKQYQQFVDSWIAVRRLKTTSSV